MGYRSPTKTSSLSKLQTLFEDKLGAIVYLVVIWIKNTLDERGTCVEESLMQNIKEFFQLKCKELRYTVVSQGSKPMESEKQISMACA